MASWWRGGSAFLRQWPTPARWAFSEGYHTIEAVPREITGCRVAARERAQGKIPAVVFYPGEGGGAVSRKQLITTESKQIKTLLKQNPFFCSTVFRLQVRAGAGSSVVLNSGSVLPIKVHKNEETGQILNLVMVWAEEGAELKVDVPVVYKGENACPGIKKGGYLQKIRSTLKYLCPTEHIPSKIEVDLTNLDIDDRVVMDDIKVHPSLKLLSRNDTMPICKISAIMPAAPETRITSAATETS